MKYIIIAVAALTVIVVITMVSAYKNNCKLIQLLKLNYGKVPVRKYNKYDMESIASYWLHRENAEKPQFTVDDVTWEDLDMEKVFMRVNSACSSVGEEYLYSTLRNQAYNEENLLKTERAIRSKGLIRLNALPPPLQYSTI